MHRCMQGNRICYNLNGSGAKQSKMQNLRIIAIYHPFVQESCPFIILLQCSLHFPVLLNKKKIKRDPVLGHQRTWMSLLVTKRILTFVCYSCKRRSFCMETSQQTKKLHFLKNKYIFAPHELF